MNYFEPYEKQFTDKDRKILISKTLEYLRRKRGLTQKEVAEILEINPVTYNGYEKGKSEPSAEMIVRLSYLFQVPTDYLLQRNCFDKKQLTLEKTIAGYKEKLDEFEEIAKEKGNGQVAEMIEAVRKFISALEELKDKNNL